MQTTERTAERALRLRAELGESPVWDERRQELLFVDILGGEVHVFRPADTTHRSFAVGRPVGAVALCDDGGLVLAASDAFYLADRDGARLVRFGEFSVGDERVRFNDAAVDPRGRLLAGTMHWGGSDPVGALYRLHGDARVETVLTGITISNGLAFSADGETLYYIDTATNTVDAFSHDPASGRLSGRRVVAEVRAGSPDGMAIDDEGLLWVAVFDGGRVERIDPQSGKTVAVVRVPTRQVTSVAFGGSRRDQLFITTAHEDFDAAALAADPDAGDLFVADPGVSGPPGHRFAPAAAPERGRAGS